MWAETQAHSRANPSGRVSASATSARSAGHGVAPLRESAFLFRQGASSFEDQRMRCGEKRPRRLSAIKGSLRGVAHHS